MCDNAHQRFCISKPLGLESGFGEEEFVRLSPMDDDEPKDAEKPPFKAGSGSNGLVKVTISYRTPFWRIMLA